MVSRHLILDSIPVTEETLLRRIKPLLAHLFKIATAFEFVTKKTGAYGPTKTECIEYYQQRYINYNYRKLIDTFLRHRKINKSVTRISEKKSKFENLLTKFFTWPFFRLHVFKEFDLSLYFTDKSKMSF